MAAAAISVAHRRGLDVPRDLSVVGFDDSSAATTVWPELTTINQPIEAMTNTAIEVLVRGIRRNDASTRVLADHVIAHRLIGRDSVAKPPRSKCAQRCPMTGRHARGQRSGVCAGDP